MFSITHTNWKKRKKRIKMPKRKIKVLKSKKLAKNSKRYNTLDIKQRRLISILHENWRQLYKHKCNGKRTKAPFIMPELKFQQIEINKIRDKINKSPISLIKDFKKTLNHL